MLAEFELRAGSVKQAIKLLGVSQAAYYDYRNGNRAIPPYIERSINAHMLLTGNAFTQLQKDPIQ